MPDRTALGPKAQTHALVTISPDCSWKCPRPPGGEGGRRGKGEEEEKMQGRSRDPRLAPRPPGAAPPLAPLRPGSCKAGSSRFSGAAPRPHPWLSAAAGLWGQSIRGAAQSPQRPPAASPGPCTCPPWTTPTLPRGSRLSAGFPSRVQRPVLRSPRSPRPRPESRRGAGSTCLSSSPGRASQGASPP